MGWLRRTLVGIGLALLVVAPARADVVVTPTHVRPQASAVVETSHVVSAAGVGAAIHGASITTGAVAGFFMILNAPADPGNGAVTPLKCIAVGANQSAGLSADPDTMWDFPKGVTLVFSTTGCFTETQSATAYFSWQ